MLILRGFLQSPIIILFCLDLRTEIRDNDVIHAPRQAKTDEQAGNSCDEQGLGVLCKECIGDVDLVVVKQDIAGCYVQSNKSSCCSWYGSSDCGSVIVDSIISWEIGTPGADIPIFSPQSG